jgi:hypothetical protein
LKVREKPEGLRFRTGTELVEKGWRVVSEEWNQVGEEGLKAGRVGRV